MGCIHTGKRAKLRDIFLKWCELHPAYLQHIDEAVIQKIRELPNVFFDDSFYNLFVRKDAQNSTYFDFGRGILFPDIRYSSEKMYTFYQVFQDVFLFPRLLCDNHSKELVEFFDPYMMDGMYGYVDGEFDVTVKNGDVVIDAGAWIGDFSVYAAGKGATAYAFEPSSLNFDLLERTAELNGQSVIPVRYGLGDASTQMEVFASNDDLGSSMYFKKNSKKEIIKITTIDEFVQKNRLPKIDFIKADIEGAECGMLRGAKKTLREFAPKLAICTYHNQKDPQLLQSIILEANPRYKVVHTRQKLFAMV